MQLILKRWVISLLPKFNSADEQCSSSACLSMSIRDNFPTQFLRTRKPSSLPVRTVPSPSGQ